MFLNIHKKKLVKIKKFPWWSSVVCRKHRVKLYCSPQVMVRACREHMCTISTLVTLIPKTGENYTNNFTFSMFSGGTNSTPPPWIFPPTFFFPKSHIGKFPIISHNPYNTYVNKSGKTAKFETEGRSAANPLLQHYFICVVY